MDWWAKISKAQMIFFKSVGCKVVPRPRATSGCLQVTSTHFQKGLFVSDGSQWFQPWNVLAQRGLRKKSSCIWKATYVSPSYETIGILHLLFKSGRYLMPIKLQSNQGLSRDIFVPFNPFLIWGARLERFKLKE